MVACGDAIVVPAAHNVATASDVVAAIGVAAADDVVVVVEAAAAVIFWVQRCWMRPCTSPQSHFVSEAVTQRGKEPSWWGNNPGPTFNNGEACVFTTIVLIAGMTLACVVTRCGSMVVMVGITLTGVVNPCRSW